MQAGLGTWRGAIPIQTLCVLPTNDCDECSETARHGKVLMSMNKFHHLAHWRDKTLTFQDKSG